MRKTQTSNKNSSKPDELQDENTFGYSKARPIRFAGRAKIVLLDSDLKTMNITLFIDTSVEIFSNWLKRFTLSISDRQFPTDKGYICLQTARGSSIRGSDMSMEGILVIEKSQEPSIAHPIGGVIQFKITALASDRTEIQAECGQTVVQEYFVDLINEINTRWPQSSKVDAQIENLRAAVEAGLADIKQDQVAISNQIGTVKHKIDQVHVELRDGRIEQGEISRAIESIRKTVRFVIQHAKNLDQELDIKVRQAEQAITDNKLNMEQKLELTLPLIPTLLTYRIEVGTDSTSELETIISELKKTLENLSTLTRKS